MQFKHLFFIITLLLSFSLAGFAQEPITLDHGGGVRTVEFSPVNASLVASAGESNLIKLWNLKNNTARTLRGHTDIVSAVAFSPNGNLLASVSDDRTIKLWNVHNSQNIATLREGTQFVTVAFSPDGQLLATGGWMHVKLWDVRRRVEIATLRHDKFVQAVAFSHDGQLLAVGDARESSGTVKVWDVESKQVVATLEKDMVVVRSVTFSPDDRYLASSHYNGEVKVWNVSDWELLRTIQRAGDYDIAFSPDGKMIAGTGNESVNLWRVEEQTKVAELPGPTGWMHPVDFSHDGAFLVVGTEDGFVRLYNMKDIQEDIEAHLQTLRQPERVRLFYFLPSDRPVRPDRVTAFLQLVKDTQQFYADEMERHGFSRKTFRVETDKDGEPVVHHIDGNFEDAYYHKKTSDKVWKEITQRFDVPKDLYVCAIDISSESIGIDVNSEIIDDSTCGEGSTVWRDGGQEIIMPASGHCFSLGLLAHELGHGFGLAHDFRDDAHIMSYGAIQNELSSCAAEWLDVSPFFNTRQNPSNMLFPVDKDITVKMLPPIEVPPNGVRLRFEVSDSDGLHQAQLYIPTTDRDPVEGSGFKLHSCRSLSGETQTLEFITTELPKENAFARLRVMDARGNFKWWEHLFPIQATDILPQSANHVGPVDTARITSETLQEISGDDQRGNPHERLPHPFVVAVRDADNEPVAGVQVTFQVTKGSGKLSITNPWTDSNGHAQAFLTLSDSLVNRVEVSVDGVSEKVIFDTREVPFDKITSPWLWMIAPTEAGQGGKNSINVDSLAEVSKGAVTETDIATKGANEGDSVGNLVWTLGEISPTGGNNVTHLINEIGLGKGDVDDHSSYALITLESVTAQSDVTMRAGSDDAIKVWLNGEIVHNNPIDRGAEDFQDKFTVDLKQGDNLLLVKVSERGGWWSMFVGIDPDVNAVYKRPTDPVASEDVNGDGIINILDLVLISANFGKTGQNPADANGDGVVNIVDLVKVAGEMGAVAAAPSAHPQTLEILTAADVRQWLTQAQQMTLTDATSQRGILILEQLLAALIPKETSLLPNYPNPFNPETWIPYQLSKPAEVMLHIYSVNGTLVRKLALGHQPAGMYHSRTRAAYWDGKNAAGESVASGIYFYTLSTGDFTATRKMLILK